MNPLNGTKTHPLRMRAGVFIGTLPPVQSHRTEWRNLPEVDSAEDKG